MLTYSNTCLVPSLDDSNPSEPTGSLSPPFDNAFAAPVSGGFGSLIEEEHELHSAIGGRLHTMTGPHENNVDRILGYHRGQIDKILGLLATRMAGLPHPDRFHALDAGAPLLTHSRRATPPDQPLLLGKLVDLHRHLLWSIEAMLEKDQHAFRDGRLLAEIAQRHDDMAWMLTALLNEDVHAADAELSPIIAFDSPSLRSDVAEQNLDNDGGAQRAAWRS